MKAEQLKYLVVENAPDVCEGIIRRMSNFSDWHSLGYAVNITNAIQLIQDKQPELIFLDWSLNGGSAFDIMQVIQSEPNYNPYIIFNTGYQKDNPEIPQEIINNYRVDKYLIKPIWENLRNNLENYLYEAKEKASQKTNEAASSIWLNDAEGVARKVNLANLICICQDPTHPRQRLFYFCTPSITYAINMQWSLCTALLKNHTIDHFITKSRGHIVCRKFIESYDRPFARLYFFPPKIEVVKENIRAFENWLLNNQSL